MIKNVSVRNDLIDKNSIRFGFEMVSSSNNYGADRLTVTAQNGESHTITFPGCYNVDLSFRIKRQLNNPYVEAFLQLGRNIPCESELVKGVGNICTNITESNWCPQSGNEQLRSMLKGKKTCRFCNLCNTLESNQSEVSKYISNVNTKECRTDKNYHSLKFKMCTPSKKELHENNKEYEEKLEEYWNYLKQGVLTAVIHITDRPLVSESKRSQCSRLCNSYSSQRTISPAYSSTLLRSIENMCNPADTYVACIYHTMKFDVSNDFTQ
uniref:Uncharacterized protein n=1 Tax=Syphacia muris TaxID=451379 RepID=A0A0N5AVE0_9BILA